MKPDRVVIGSNSPKAREVLRHLYAAFVRATDRIHAMDARSAELTKYAANALLATRISFMNDLAMLAEKLGADIELRPQGRRAPTRASAPSSSSPAPASAAPASPRTSPRSSSPPTAVGHDLALVRATEEVNAPPEEGARRRRSCSTSAARSRAARSPSGASRSSPQTDDIRESPALTLIDDLLAAGAAVQAHDPQAMPNVKAIYGDRVHFADSMYGAAEGADALVLVTEWHEYRTPDFHRLLQADEGAGALRRAQHVGARRGARARLHLRGHRAALARLSPGARSRR